MQYNNKNHFIDEFSKNRFELTIIFLIFLVKLKRSENISVRKNEITDTRRTEANLTISLLSPVGDIHSCLNTEMTADTPNGYITLVPITHPNGETILILSGISQIGKLVSIMTIKSLY